MVLSEIIEVIGEVVDAAGVALIVIGLLLATGRFLARLGRSADAYRRYREGLGRSLLLGLEFLVAADIIRTVAIEPNFYNLGILAVIVLIRTFLSWSLELELEGRWPWQSRARVETTAPPRSDAG
jgi:uncharacterized membrane protein